MVRFSSRSSKETQHLAGRLLRQLIKLKYQPLILALAGELGSGKTTFIQGLAQALGIREKVQSPTFVLMKWYRPPRASSKGSRKRFHQFQHFIHIDAYRLERAAEARHLGLKDIFKDRDAIIVVEWAERIRKLIPRGAKWLKFYHGRKPNERVITINE